ncbi:unnamed protein product [Urochloa humidicola]
MAVVVSGSRARAEQARMQWRREQEPRSPDMAAAPPRPPRPRPARAAVVYYLSRNGHLEHPHFMEVALPCPDGLYLRDVIDRLDALRGKGMARMYSWASKRSYRNGFVWHDLADDDYIHPVVGREYVLKGTERLHPPALPPPPPPAAALLDAAAASSSSSGSQDTPTSSSSARWDAHRSKSDSAELGEYVVYKGEDRAADAATQTEDAGAGRPRRAHAKAAQEELRLSRADTTSPPPTASTSPETLEALIRADGRVVAAVSGSGRARASSRAHAAHLLRLRVRARRARLPGDAARPPPPPPPHPPPPRAAAPPAGGGGGGAVVPREDRGGQGVLQREHHRDREALAGRRRGPGRGRSPAVVVVQRGQGDKAGAGQGGRGPARPLHPAEAQAQERRRLPGHLLHRAGE